MDFNRAGTELEFPYASSGLKWSFFVHSTTYNAPYVHPRLDSILELCQTYPIGSDLDQDQQNV